MKPTPHQRQPHKNNKLHQLAHPLVQRVPRKPHIVQGNLEPARPQDAEEANVGDQVRLVGDGVVGCECGEVGDEEEVEEELGRVGFVALRENERGVVGAEEGGFDPGGGFVQAAEVFFFVAGEEGWMG